MKNIVDYPRIEATQAVILARVSSREQEEGYSVEAQKYRQQSYCQKRNLNVLRMYEITESSTRGDRKKFLEMIKFCKSQKQPVAIVADKIDRVQRSLREFPLLDALIQEGKIELHFTTENYIIHKNSVSHERLMWSIGIIMAQAYTDSLRDNVKRSIDHKVRLGEFPTMAPVGYLNVRNEHGKSEIIVDEMRAMIIRKIFTEFATGLYTLKQITQKAREWGLRGKTHSGNPLNRSHIHRLFHNPFYYGMMELKGKMYPHKYPPLVDKRIFDKCQDILKGRKQQPSKYGKTEFVFRGLLRCANSGRTISTFIQKRTYKNGGTAEWTYLRSWDKQGKAVYVREEVLTQQAERALKAMALPSDIAASIKGYIRSTSILEHDFMRRQTDELTKEKNRINTRVTGLVELLMDGAITRDEFDTRKAQYCNRLIEVENLIVANRKGDEGFKDTLIFMLDWCNRVENLFKGSTTELKRRIVNSALSNLILDEATLCFSYKTPFAEFMDAAKTGEWRALVDRFRTSLPLRQALMDIGLSELMAINTAFAV